MVIFLLRIRCPYRRFSPSADSSRLDSIVCVCLCCLCGHCMRLRHPKHVYLMANISNSLDLIANLDCHYITSSAYSTQHTHVDRTNRWVAAHFIHMECNTNSSESERLGGWDADESGVCALLLPLCHDVNPMARYSVSASQNSHSHSHSHTYQFIQS